jgi:S1-C subfamily serine protease
MKSILILITLFLIACGTDGKDGTNGANGKNGEDGKNGADGSNGKDGTNGKDGEDGTDGKTIQQDIFNIYSKYRKSVYRVTTFCDGVAQSFGSAFKIAERVAATNEHVANFTCGGVRSIRIERVYDYLDTLNGNAIFATTFSLHSSADLAKLYFSEDLPGEVVSIGSSDNSKTGDQTLSLSFPLGFEDLYTLPGSVTSNYLGECYGGSGYGCPAAEYDLITTNDTDHGSSGSPILDLTTGECIGVTTAGTNGENMNVTWAINCDKLNDF